MHSLNLSVILDTTFRGRSPILPMMLQLYLEEIRPDETMTSQPQPGTINQIIEQVVHHVNNRCPEALDNIFDNLTVNTNSQVLTGAIAVLSSDVDLLSWFCGYFAGEINRSEDNLIPHHPITKLTKILIEAGMQPFIDFTPYPGCRLVITNITFFESLPEDIKVVVRKAFDFIETPDKQIQQMNNALLQELVVREE